MMIFSDVFEKQLYVCLFPAIYFCIFVFPGSSFVVSMGSFLDVSNWLNPAKLTLYYQTNSSTQWVQDYCGQRTTEPCEQLCDEDTGQYNQNAPVFENNRNHHNSNNYLITDVFPLCGVPK